MLQTSYHVVYSDYEATLRGESQSILRATKLVVDNVTESNPARAELLDQIILMEHAIQQSNDCEITEQKHGYLRSVFLNLFDAGEVHLLSGKHVYSNETVKKERWTGGTLPEQSRGGLGGFQYKNEDDQIVFRQTTWIS